MRIFGFLGRNYFLKTNAAYCVSDSATLVLILIINPLQLRDIESDKIRERYKIEKKQVEEEEESEDEEDSFGPKKNKEEDLDDPVARKFFYFPLEAPLVLSCVFMVEILICQSKCPKRRTWMTILHVSSPVCR
jgi:hypothetical protein